MCCVHYKFAARLGYRTVPFNGLFITVSGLKRLIMDREKLKPTASELRLYNAQTNEEYTDGGALLLKNLSVLVRRAPPSVPMRGGTAAVNRANLQTESQPESHKAAAEAPPASSDQLHQQLAAMENFAESGASEEDKIKAMMIQATRFYPIHLMKKPSDTLPPNYICFRCSQPGHYIRNCPTIEDEGFKPRQRLKRSLGIPRSFLVDVPDAGVKGALLTSTGSYCIPKITADAYASEKKNKARFCSSTLNSILEPHATTPTEKLIAPVMPAGGVASSLVGSSDAPPSKQEKEAMHYFSEEVKSQEQKQRRLEEEFQYRSSSNSSKSRHGFRSRHSSEHSVPHKSRDHFQYRRGRCDYPSHSQRHYNLPKGHEMMYQQRSADKFGRTHANKAEEAKVKKRKRKQKLVSEPETPPKKSSRVAETERFSLKLQH